MFLKKTDQGYFISGGIYWIPLLPGKIKTRKDFDDYYRGKHNDPRKDFVYATDEFKPARLYEVYWRNGIYAQAKEDEDRTLVINVPPYATKNQISDALRQRAKTMDNKEVVIVFTEEAPIPPEQVPED